MGEIKPSLKAHPFFALMFTSEGHYGQIVNQLKKRFGEILGFGPVYKVSDFTDYYEEEFGLDLQKQMFVFREPRTLENFHDVKVWTNGLEISMRNKHNESRSVNIDPGYLEPSKLVLYSTKNFSHRVHVGKGIFAEVTIIYEHGKFKFLPWTYPDYSWERNIEFLLKMRREIVKFARETHLPSEEEMGRQKV